MLYQWERFANCKHLDTALFYDYETDQRKRVPEEVRAACKGCPVRESCLEHALAKEFYGFYAGTTAGERRRMRKRQPVKIPVAVTLKQHHHPLLES